MLLGGQCVMLHETPYDTVHCRSHIMQSFKSERLLPKCLHLCLHWWWLIFACIFKCQD